MGVREDRLFAEYASMKKWRSDVVSWKTIGNSNPPDKYEFRYNLTSIVGFDTNSKPILHKGFTVLVEFPLNYPRIKPEINLDMKSKPWPFHPNIFWKEGVFCLEGTQHWIPGIGVSITSMCQMMGEMIAFQEVFIKNPANSNEVLLNWVEKNLRLEEGTLNKIKNPIDSSVIRLPDIEDTLVWGNDEKNKSSNSGKIVFGE